MFGFPICLLIDIFIFTFSFIRTSVRMNEKSTHAHRHEERLFGCSYILLFFFQAFLYRAVFFLFSTFALLQCSRVRGSALPPREPSYTSFCFLFFFAFLYLSYIYIYIYIFVLWIHTFPSTFFFLFFCTHNPAREFLSCSIELACSKKGLCRAFNSLLFSLELRERTIYAFKKKKQVGRLTAISSREVN